jgi:diguanylate cyclase (GGDEF)-like protein
VEGATRDPIHAAFITAVRLFEAGRASLLIRQPNESVLTVVAAVGIAPSVIPKIRVPIGQGIAGIVAERGLSLFGAFDHETFLSLPIITAQGVEGVLNLTDRLGGKQFTANDLTSTKQITRLIARLLEYSRQSSIDPVSGLPNRRAVEEALERELARSERTGIGLAVVFADLDNLKQINDRLGHARGDEVIRGVGTALKRVIRPYDVAGRFGGDEFVLILSGVTDTNSGIVKRIRDAVSLVARQLELDVSISVGVARYPIDGTDAEQLLRTADARMYEQKRAKRR